MIKRYAAERHSMKGQNKLTAKAMLIKCFENYSETNLRSYFNKWVQWKTRCNTRDVKMRVALKNMSVHCIRSYFLTWKDKAF